MAENLDNLPPIHEEYHHIIKMANYNPFKSSLLILYKFNFQKDGLTVMPVHYYRYIFTMAIWLLSGVGIALVVEQITGIREFGLIFFLPCAAVFFIGAYRINLDLKWTYGSQIINSVKIADGIMSIEYLEPTGGMLHFIQNFFDSPKRNVEDTVNFPISAIGGVNFAEEYVNDATYYSLIASVVTYDVNDEPHIFEMPISPRLRKLKDVSFYCNLIDYLMPHLHEEVATSEGE
mgnify:CR=1 FL=1|tara:strand:+ start:186 stop:884 length:699 start_codon:yes stop_codon:yes gene_type:complete